MSFQAYKFETKVLQDGIIQIPQMLELTDKDIEVFIFVKPPVSTQNNSHAIDSFLNKWTGSLNNVNYKESKSNYLNEKYK